MLTHVPPRLATRVRDGLVAVRALTEAAAWIEDRRTDVLVLEGDTGCGKSVAAAWCFAFSSYRARYSPAGMRADPVWCDAAIVADSLAEWSPEWSKFDTAPLVVLDDVGTERKPERMTTILERLFNVASGRAVITTNLSPEDFAARYGARVRSRVIGEGSWVACAEPDMRMETPAGLAFREPDEPTQRELDAKRRREAEQRKLDAEALSPEEIQRRVSEHLATVSKLDHAKRLRVEQNENERRRELQKQIQALRENSPAVDEGDDEEQVH